MESLEEQFGYDESIFISEIPEHLLCMICTLVLRDPIQILCCGHKACELCFERIKNYSTMNNTELRCPVDRELVDLTDVREDISMRRVVRNMVVRCYECDHGCMWQGDLSELDNHTKQCQFKPPKQGGENEMSCAMNELADRMERCETSLTNKDKEIALLKNQLQNQQQTNEEIQSLKQQVSKLAWKNMETEQKMQQEKLQQQQGMADLRKTNEALERQMTELSQKNIELEEKQQQQEQQHEKLKQQYQQDINNLKVIHDDQQLKIGVLTTEVEKFQKGAAPCGNVGSTISSSTQLFASDGQPGSNFVEKQPIVTRKREICMELHNGDPNNVTISKDTHSVEFTGGGYTTVSARAAVVPPTSKVWYEVKCIGGTFGWFYVGWCTSDLPTSKSCTGIGNDVHSYSFNPSVGDKCHNRRLSKWGKKLTGNRGVVGVALDLVKGEMLFSVGGQWTQPMGVAFKGLPTGIELFPAFSSCRSTVHYNFGDRDFTFGPPDPTFVKLLDVL